MPSRRVDWTPVVEGQREAVERLKASLFGADPYVQSKYIQDFHREFRTYRARMRREDVLAACQRADIVLVGDYHALPSCQNFAADLLQFLAASRRPLILFLEMVFSRDQRALDRYLAGEIDEQRLRRAIRYDREWGYAWEGYGRLLRAAKDAGIPVVAADAPPRGGLRLIRRRDRHAAAKVREYLTAQQSARAMILFGESHVARGHLPRELRSELGSAGRARSCVVVVQNVEEIYWRLAREGDDTTEAVAIDKGRYAVLNASPLAKYEAYRQTLLRWAQQEDEGPDFLPSLHHLIDLLVGFLGIDPYRGRVPRPHGGSVPLVDLYPEVVTRRNRRRVVRGGTAGPRRRGVRAGVVYRRGPNRIDVYEFSIVAAAQAASRFLLEVLRGRAGAPMGASPAGPAHGRSRRATQAASRVLDEAFVAFAVRYLDPGVAGIEPASTGRRHDRRSRRFRLFEGLAAILADLEGAGTAERGRRLLRREAAARPDRSESIGASLSREIYSRSRRTGLEPRTRRWLLEVGRLGSRRPQNSPRPTTLMRLLVEGGAQVGIRLRETTRGEALRGEPRPAGGVLRVTRPRG